MRAFANVSHSSPPKERNLYYTTRLSNYSTTPRLDLPPHGLLTILLLFSLLFYNSLLEPLALNLPTIAVQIHVLESNEMSLVIKLPADEEDEEDGDDDVGDLLLGM